ncbi:polysaccharide biosynthesis/export family protein [Arenibaculum sp.]|jgi:polysaccharide export outer membrane protein|uniref:polysaccharide biosynthesis/export family protein n=1 Tax=Arenibaculum sp. TaxID=2865862 RepID=UPI002E0EFB70|nr:polysaccharide biosynthesis/export family protein [Arenibaculum sp.]
MNRLTMRRILARLLRFSFPGHLAAFCLLALALAVVPVARPGAQEAPEYTLGTSDKVRVTVFGENDLSGEFEVDTGGGVSLPLIGTVHAKGRGIRDLERAIAEKLADGYLISPRVSIEVLNYRPFFILGEVQDPGSYPYVNGMTVLNAIALAGGYTHRARRDRIEIVRGGEAGEVQKDASETSIVMPGDIIRVPERFF